MIPFRLVSETLGYEVGYDETKGIPYINTSKHESPEEEPEEEEEDLSHLNRVYDIRKERISGKEALVIYNMDKVSINTMELKNPDRIVIDIKDSLFRRYNRL